MVSGVGGRLNILEKIIFCWFIRWTNKEKEIIFFLLVYLFIYLFFSNQRFGEMPVYHFVS
jgi:4-amino-4-deoxy-L-arabinose transferase-like glycosyltransferase